MIKKFIYGVNHKYFVDLANEHLANMSFVKKFIVNTFVSFCQVFGFIVSLIFTCSIKTSISNIEVVRGMMMETLGEIIYEDWLIKRKEEEKL